MRDTFHDRCENIIYRLREELLSLRSELESMRAMLTPEELEIGRVIRGHNCSTCKQMSGDYHWAQKVANEMEDRVDALESSLQRMTQAVMLACGHHSDIYKEQVERMRGILMSVLMPSPDLQTPSPQRATGVNEHWCTDSDEITRSGQQRVDKDEK